MTAAAGLSMDSTYPVFPKGSVNMFQRWRIFTFSLQWWGRQEFSVGADRSGRHRGGRDWQTSRVTDTKPVSSSLRLYCSALFGVFISASVPAYFLWLCENLISSRAWVETLDWIVLIIQACDPMKALLAPLSFGWSTMVTTCRIRRNVLDFTTLNAMLNANNEQQHGRPKPSPY